MNLLLRTTLPCLRLSPSTASSASGRLLLLSKPPQQPTTTTSIIMRQLSSPSRSLHTHTRTQTHTKARSINHNHNSNRHRHRQLAVALGLGSIPFLAPGRPTLNDTYASDASSADFSSSSSAAGGKKNVPVFKGGKLNPDAVRQISFGGILGLGLGVLFSMLSRMLVLLLGVGVVVWQYAARKGYNFIPVERVQRYVKGIDVRSAIQDNVAFKISFGLMFALTAFGEF